MIRVNLLKSRVPSSGGEEFQDLAGLGGDSQGSFAGEGLGLKVVLLLAFTVGLVGYEYYNISQLKDRRNRMKAQLGQVRAQVEQVRQEAKRSEELNKRSKGLEEEVESLVSLSRQRLQELKALDYLQSAIPEKVWLSQIEYRSQQLDLKGFSVTEDDLNSFVSQIEKKPYFSKVILLKKTENKQKKSPVFEFHIRCSLEVTS